MKNYNPFAQAPFYWNIAFCLPQAAAEATYDAFDDMALSVSAFEIDEAQKIWKVDLLFIDAPDVEEITRRLLLLTTVYGGALPELTQSKIEQQDWLSLVARNFPPLIVPPFYVHGSHVKETPPLASIPIQVEAGAAFGSGEHGTTHGCLLALAHIAKHAKPERILDMGTGSGILAIAAAKLWNAKILAVDIDPVAVEVTKENIAINRVQRCIRTGVSDGYLSAVTQKFGGCDVIIANILARPLISFAPYLARQLKPQGYAILSGLLADQEHMVFAAHRLQGLSVVKRFYREGWVSLLLQKNAI